MKVRRYKVSDLETLRPWFTARGYPPSFPAHHQLPLNGWVAEDEQEQPVAACWLYSTDSSLSLVEWTVTRPGLGLKALRGVRGVVEAAKDFAKIRSLDLVQVIPNKKLAKFYEKSLGFKATETATVMYWRG